MWYSCSVMQRDYFRAVVSKSKLNVIIIMIMIIKKKVLLHWNVFVYGAFKVHNPSFKQMKYLMIGSHSALTPKPS